jgi:dihydroflavonol-4-reductase
MRQNGDGTALILDAARKWGVAKTVIVSSACTLGLSTTPDAVLDETATASPFLARANPYLASKLRAEDEAMRRAREMEVVMVNPTTVYGRGDRTLNSGTLVAQVARSPVVPVPPGGGNVVDVDDVARGILAAAEQGRSGRRYVLGGENLSFAANIETITRVVGRRPVMVPLPAWTRCAAVAAARVASAMPGGRFLTPQIVADLYAFKYYSTARAAAELNWRPRVPFEESVRQAWEFYRKEGLI